MSTLYFTGERTAPLIDGHKLLPHSLLPQLTAPEHYDTEPGLVDAVNVALMMGQPLLITGEPGTGKTQLAYRIAWELGFDPPLKFETKSTSSARDLFYYYNSLARFHAAHDGNAKQTAPNRRDGVDYITYNALGIAIIRASKKGRYQELLPANFTQGEPRRSVVLIDEIDKAPRDFPNDILNEIENMYFYIPELYNARVESDPAMQPVVVITSNSEKMLPDAFLRRCVYYHIEFPDARRLKTIIEKRVQALSGKSQTFLDNAIELFLELREPRHGLHKKPATAELIIWLEALRRTSRAENPVTEDTGSVLATLGTLIKSIDDLETARSIVKGWQARQT